MSASVKSLGIDRLPIVERLTLVDEIWDSIATDSGAVPVTGAQRLEKRIAEDDAQPDDVTPWEQIKASTLSRLGNDRTPVLQEGCASRLRRGGQLV